MAVRTRRRSIFRQAVASNAPPTPANASAVWWADDIAQADGSQVATWTDRVNNISVTQATAGARPLYDVDGLNCKPALSFNGTDNYLRYPGTLTTSDAGCVVVVANLPTVDSNYRYLFSTSDEASLNYWLGGGYQTMLRQVFRNGVTGTSRVTESTNSIVSGYTALEWSSSGTSGTVRQNNHLATTTSVIINGTSTTLAPDGVWIGDATERDSFGVGALVRSTTGSYFNGHIAYLGVFNSPLSTQDRYNLYKWIEQYYGITGMPGLSDYEQTVLADSPAAFWPMQETSGNLIDVTGGNRNLSVGGGTPDYYQSGIGNFKSINFDGSTEWLYANDSDIFSSPSFSLEAWVNLDSLSANAFLFEKRGGSGTDTLEYHFYAYPPSGLWFQMGNLSASNYVSLGGSSALFPNTTGTWFHCVATFNDTDGHANVYCNGILVAGTTTTNGSRAGNSSGSLRIGRRSINAYGPMDGRVSMSAFYPHALTQPQIQAHYEAMTT